MHTFSALPPAAKLDEDAELQLAAGRCDVDRVGIKAMPPSRSGGADKRQGVHVGWDGRECRRLISVGSRVHVRQ